MKKINTILSASLFLLAAGPVLADSRTDTTISNHDNGGYDSSLHKDSVDDLGTRTVIDKERNVSVDKNGKVTTTVDSSTVKDPKGLANKETARSSVTTESDPRGNFSRSASSNKVDAEGTRVKTTSELDTRVHPDGRKTTESATRTIEDPRGMLNKRTIDTRTTEVEELDGSTRINKEERIDGVVVKQESAVK
jgi:hypothetical protein